MPLKYLLDENVDFAYLNQLQIKMPDLVVKAVREPGYPAIFFRSYGKILVAVT